ncbi:uncharacterized protein LOC8055416 [Sorghum bicolor]|nr:uncharacterized protein LOC8055416 [Sorghum bicolor]|eukprot:XP_002454077.2 uncharacterized protein LOC8055416 [Sorghum bicolor]
MKQKIVIRVHMECDRCRSKALALVAATGGVDSVSLAGDARDQVVVVGDDVDSIKLASALRKKVGPAEIVQVAAAEAKKEESGAGGKNPPATTPTALPEFVASTPWYYYQHYPQPAAVVYEHPAAGYACAYGDQTRTGSICSIM